MGALKFMSSHPGDEGAATDGAAKPGKADGGSSAEDFYFSILHRETAEAAC
jgi:hypothetical protein